MFHGPDRAFAVAERLFQQTNAEGIEVVLQTLDRGMSRFANSYIHQNMAETNHTCTVRVAYGQQVGVACGNDTSPEGLVRTLRTAETIARLQRPNEHFPGLAGPQQYAPLDSWDQATADFTPLQRAEALKGIFDHGLKDQVTLAGMCISGGEEFALANSAGLRAYQASTFASLNCVAITPSFSGGAQGISRRIGELDISGIGDKAISKALQGQDPAELEPGKYDVILEPQAICELVEWIGYVGLGSRAMEEELSFLHGRIGQPVAGANITLYDDAREGGYSWAFDLEGMPKQRVHFIEEGIAKGIVYDRVSGQRAGVPSTGHSAGSRHMGEGSAAMHIHLKGGEDTPESLLSQVERGIYITRTHYVNGLLEPRELLMTGLTRDGAFLIENGKVTRGIKNLRFTDSILGALNRVGGLSREREACPAWWGATGSYLMPYVLIRDFAFTGKSDH